MKVELLPELEDALLQIVPLLWRLGGGRSTEVESECVEEALEAEAQVLLPLRSTGCLASIRPLSKWAT